MTLKKSDRVMKNLIQKPNKHANVNWSLGMSCLNDRNWLDDRAIDNCFQM